MIAEKTGFFFGQRQLNHLLTNLIQIRPDEIKENKKRNQRGSAEDILIRQKYLSEVEDALLKKLRYPPPRAEIIAEMAKLGFTMSGSTLYRDQTSNAHKNNFVKELMTEGNYSRFQDHSMQLVTFVEEEAILNYQKTWTMGKTIQRKTAKGTFTETVVTEELATPKAQFLTILANVVKLRTDLTNGKNIKLASALAAREHRKLKEQLADLQRRNVELEQELKELMKESQNLG